MSVEGYFTLGLSILAAVMGYLGWRSSSAKEFSEALGNALTSIDKLQKRIEVVEIDKAKLEKEMDAAYVRIDELKRRERALIRELGDQKADYEKKIATLEAKVDILVKQLIAEGKQPITGLDSDPDIKVKG